MELVRPHILLERTLLLQSKDNWIMASLDDDGEGDGGTDVPALLQMLLVAAPPLVTLLVPLLLYTEPTFTICTACKTPLPVQPSPCRLALTGRLPSL